MPNSRAQYLTIDAFIASMIVAITVVLVVAARVGQHSTAQSELLSRGVAETLSEAKLADLNNPLVLNMSVNGTITSLDNTVLQQAAEFYFTDNRHYASEMLRNVTHKLIPPQYSFTVIVNGDVLYNRTLTSENASTLLTSSRKLVFGVANRTVLLYGPAVAEVRVWQ